MFIGLKSNWVRLAAAYTVLALSAALANASTTVTLRLSSASPAGMDDSKALVETADFIRQKSGGTLAIQPFFASALFDEIAGMGAAQSGLVDMAIACTCNMTKQTNLFLFADLPYMFKSMDNGREVWDGPLGQKMRAELRKSTGLLPLAFAPSGGGYRVLWNSRRPVRTPEDLKGLKIRTTATPVEQEFWKMAGAVPTPIDVKEIYSAMQQGVVDGQHIQPAWAHLLKHDEVTKYGTEIGALAVYRMLVINEKSFARLSPEHQKLLAEAMKFFEERAYHHNREGRAASMKAIQAKGVQIQQLTAEQLAQWQKLGAEFRQSPTVRKLVSQEVIDAAISTQK